MHYDVVLRLLSNAVFPRPPTPAGTVFLDGLVECQFIQNKATGTLMLTLTGYGKETSNSLGTKH